MQCSHLLARTVQTMQTNALRPFGISVSNYYLTRYDNPEFDIRVSVHRLYGFLIKPIRCNYFWLFISKRLYTFRAVPPPIISSTLLYTQLQVLSTVILTPWCRVFLEKLTGLQLVKKLLAFHETRRFITALTSVRHLSLSWASPIQSIYPHPTSWRSILVVDIINTVGSCS